MAAKDRDRFDDVSIFRENQGFPHPTRAKTKGFPRRNSRCERCGRQSSVSIENQTASVTQTSPAPAASTTPIGSSDKTLVVASGAVGCNHSMFGKRMGMDSSANS